MQFLRQRSVCLFMHVAEYEASRMSVVALQGIDEAAVWVCE
jgi:hypothetical protein